MNKPEVEILTCSTALDIELFSPLADSIDRHVSPEIMHTVVVPRSDMRKFSKFSSDRRTLIAQEDILPKKLIKSPKFLRHLEGLRAGFRRPFYVTTKGEVVVGWMLQQFLKIELARRSDARALMHVDSDVAFIRPFEPKMAFREGVTSFFKVDASTANPMHDAWVSSSCDFLGVQTPDGHKSHYVENCVLWDTSVARAMVQRIEQTNATSLFDAIIHSETMSEYYLYGLFVHHFPDKASLVPEEVSYCNSFWPRSKDAAVTIDAFIRKLDPKHVAVAVQSTHNIDLNRRLALYAEIETSGTQC